MVSRTVCLFTPRWNRRKLQKLEGISLITEIIVLERPVELNCVKVPVLLLTCTIMALNKSLLMHCLVRYSLSTATYWGWALTWKTLKLPCKNSWRIMTRWVKQKRCFNARQEGRGEKLKELILMSARILLCLLVLGHHGGHMQPKYLLIRKKSRKKKKKNVFLTGRR